MKMLPHLSQASSFGRSTSSGFTLVEAALAGTIAAMVLGLTAYSVQRESNHLRDILETTASDTRAREILGRVERELEYAQATLPEAFLTEDLSSGDGTADVDGTAGFPDFGTLLLDPGSADEERISYRRTSAAGDRFEGLTRGVRCGRASAHDQGDRVRWEGSAFAIEDQINPPVSFFDGRSAEAGGTVFFRGDGTGFSFRVPTDPTGGTDYVQGEEVLWGATVVGQPTLDGWSCFYYEAANQLSEVEAGMDLNADGDEADTFDLGRIRMRSWDSANPGAPATDVALGPAFVLQEQCNWASDLDGDGFEDPMFLWDATQARLRVRLFVLEGTINARPSVERLETSVFLTNGSLEE